MPELPEVETIVRQLSGHLPGRCIRKVVVHRPGLLRESGASFRKGLEGRVIEDVGRRGKNILLSLSDSHFLRVNLGMTGQLLMGGESADNPTPTHLGLTFSLEPVGILYYADVRRFGHLIRYDRSEWEEESARLGPEPLGESLLPGRLFELLQRSRSPIRSWLLDQTRIAGVGNIYAAESLFRARIHPVRPSCSLSTTESKDLLRALRIVLTEAIHARGTTLRDYRTASGEEGGFGPSLDVYGRGGEECPRCKALIQRIVFGGRSAFFCPICQSEAP